MEFRVSKFNEATICRLKADYSNIISTPLIQDIEIFGLATIKNILRGKEPVRNIKI